MSLSQGVERLTGIRVRIGPEIKTLTYAVTRHRVVLLVHLAHAYSGSLQPGPGLLDAALGRHVGTGRVAAGLGGPQAGGLGPPACSRPSRP